MCNNRLHEAGPGMSGASSPYLSIVAVLVESYVLDSAWSLAIAISDFLHSPAYLLFMTADSSIKVRDLPVTLMVLL